MSAESSFHIHGMQIAVKLRLRLRKPSPYFVGRPSEMNVPMQMRENFVETSAKPAVWPSIFSRSRSQVGRGARGGSLRVPCDVAI